MSKILVVNMNYMGDALFTTPAIRVLRERNPDARIDTVAGEGSPAEVLKGNPDLDTVIVRTARDSFGRCAQLYQVLRAERYDSVYILPPLPAYAIASYLAGTPNRIGQGGRGMNRFLTRTPVTTAEHMADAMLDTVLSEGEERPANRRLVVGLADADRERATRLISEAGLDEPFVVVNVGATRPQKRWQAESFAAVMDSVDQARIALVGAGVEDAAIVDDVLRACKKARPVNLVGRTTVKELAAVLEQAALLVSADSGPLHLATAVGTPVLALFGSTDPRTTGPYDDVSQSIYKALSCAPCFNHPTCEGRFDCMRAILPSEVAERMTVMLRASGPGTIQLPVAAAPGVRPRNGAGSGPTARPPRNGKDGSPRSVLIVTKFRFMGDTLVATPILRAARTIWPNARITLLTGKSARVLLKNNPYLDEIVELDPNKADKGFRPFLRLLKRLRGGRYDVCLALNRSFHSALIPWMSGIKVRSGFESEGRGLMLTKRVDYDRDKSEVLCYFDILRSVAPDAPIDPRLELWVTDEERAGALEWLRKEWGDRPWPRTFIGIQPGASQGGKRWPHPLFAELADRLAADEPEAALVIVGGPDEVGTADAMRAACSDATRTRIVSCPGRCNLRESLGVLTHLSLFVGADTAIMHAAAALSVPTVALFGPTNAHKWGNYGECRRVLQSPDGTMGAIGVDAVLDAVHDLRP